MKAILVTLFGLGLALPSQAQSNTPTQSAAKESPARQSAMSHPQRNAMPEAQKAQLKDQEEGPQSKSPGNPRAKRPRSFAPSQKSEVPKQAETDQQ